MIAFHIQQKEVARPSCARWSNLSGNTAQDSYLRSNQEVAIVHALAPFNQRLHVDFAIYIVAAAAVLSHGLISQTVITKGSTIG